MTTGPVWNIPYPYQLVFDALLAVLPMNGMQIAVANPEQGLVTAKTGINLATWGENIQAQLWYLDEHWTAVQVTSNLKFGLFDWGKNSSNVTTINGALSRYLDGGFLAYRAPNFGAPPPPPPATP